MNTTYALGRLLGLVCRVCEFCGRAGASRCPQRPERYSRQSTVLSQSLPTTIHRLPTAGWMDSLSFMISQHSVRTRKPSWTMLMLSERARKSYQVSHSGRLATERIINNYHHSRSLYSPESTRPHPSSPSTLNPIRTLYRLII